MKKITTVPVKNLLSIRALRNACKDLEDSMINEVINNLNLIKTENTARLQKESQQDSAKKEYINNILDQMKNQGITLKELQNLNPKKKASAEPKYKYWLEDGSVEYWSGRGRTPVELNKCMQRDNQPKEHYMIQK